LEESAGKVLAVPIEDEMKRSYIDYAMSVIVSRALPDVRDGLKPVHRRILYAMSELNLTPDRPYKKSARVVGEVLGKYHPHGDVSVYDAMVRMAQDFSSRYLLVDGHGNFGSIDGDSPAAMRYTEARLAPLAMEMLRDIDKETVDVGPNFDETLKEPLVMPCRFPNLLVNGSAGIAVGMATNLPPHNLGEVVDGILMMIEKPDVTSNELMQAIKGPDFPTGGLILGRDGIRQAYETGRGIVRMRALARIEPVGEERFRIVVSELPYQVNKARLLEKIADLVREKRVEGIADLRDESDRATGLRITIDVKRGANPNVILNRLYKYTPMEQTFGIIMLALVDGRPRVLDLRSAVYYYLEHQKDVVTRRARYDLRKAEERAHILEGIRIALDNIDRVIALIRGSSTVDEARQGLMQEFGLTERQAQAILDMRLQRLTGLEREKVEEEHQELLKTIEYLRAVLGSERMVLNIIKRELLDIKKRFADERRTRLTRSAGDIEEEDLIAEEDVVITCTHRGYIKRLPLSTYRQQRRGGRGVVGVQMKEHDFVENVFIATTHHWMLFFTNRGKVYRLKAYEIPEFGRQAKGTAIVNLIELEPGEEVNAVIPVREFEQGRYLLMATRRGMVKKTELTQYDTTRRSGLIAIGLEEGDELIGVRLTDGSDRVVLVSRDGWAIVFREEEVRPMGRDARGVKGVRLEGTDRVATMDIVSRGNQLLVVTDKGFGKRTPLEEYPTYGRASRGVRTIRLTERNGSLVGARVVNDDDGLLLVSSAGVMIRLRIAGISSQGRNTQGVTLMRLPEDDSVVALARIPAREG